jgi:hypothetical protein
LGKYFAQKNIKEIHDIVRSSKYKREEGKLKFLELSRLIKYNENRDNWKHLNKFYKE